MSGFKVRVIRPGTTGTPQLDKYPHVVTVEELDQVSKPLAFIIFPSGNGIEQLKVGDVLPSRVGGRMVVKAWWDGQNPMLAFYENGTLYEQNALWFWSDSWMEAFQTGAYWARGGSAIAQIQVAFAMGMMGAGLGAVANLALTAVNIMEFVTSDEFRFLKHAIPYLLDARDIMKEHFPTLYDRVFSLYMEELKAAVGKQLAISISAQLVGRFVGRFGRAESKNLKGLVIDLSAYFLLFKAVSAGKAFGDAAKKLTAADLQSTLQKAGKTVSLADAQKMADEIKKNWPKFFELQRLFQKAANPYDDDE